MHIVGFKSSAKLVAYVALCTKDDAASTGDAAEMAVALLRHGADRERSERDEAS